MKLTNLALLGAIFGPNPNATAATDAITGINDPRKRKLSSSSSSSSSSSDYSIASTKSAKFSKASDIDYQATAATIVAGLGCVFGSLCGDECYTVDPAAEEALRAISTGVDELVSWTVPVHYGFGICDSNMVCQDKIPSLETDQDDVDVALEFFKEVQDECEEADPSPNTIGLAGLFFIKAAAAMDAIYTFNPGSALATVPTVRELLQSYASTTDSDDFHCQRCWGSHQDDG